MVAVGSLVDRAVAMTAEGDRQSSGKRGEGREERRRRRRALDRGEERRGETGGT
jgi:hypothetical protein